MDIQGALPLPGSAAFLQVFQVHNNHNIDNAQKHIWGLGPFRRISTGKREKRRDGVSCLVDQAVQGVWIRWMLEAEQEGCAVVFLLRMLQSTCHGGQTYCGAKQPAQPSLTLASSFLAWKHRDLRSH